LRASKIL